MLTPEVEEFHQMDRDALLDHWARIFGGAPPVRLSSPFLRRILAFELQSRQFGGLSRSFVQSLREVDSGNRPAKNTKHNSGGRLIREWNGVTHVVDSTENGYVWRGQNYRSLSAIARGITGAHWSGPRFFGINKPKNK